MGKRMAMVLQCACLSGVACMRPIHRPKTPSVPRRHAPTAAGGGFQGHSAPPPLKSRRHTVLLEFFYVRIHRIRNAASRSGARTVIRLLSGIVPLHGKSQTVRPHAGTITVWARRPLQRSAGHHQRIWHHTGGRLRGNKRRDPCQPCRVVSRVRAVYGLRQSPRDVA